MKRHERTLATLLCVACVLLAGAAFAQDAPSKDEPTANDAVAEIDVFIAEQEIDKNSPNWKTHLSKPPKQTFDAGKKYYWFLETSEGDIKIELLPETAPMHVTSTIYLTRLGFYDGLTFHRVIPGFMAQGGCPLGTGTGGPGYKYAGEFNSKVKHDGKGKLSMANAGPGTDGSQFFLTFRATPHLDGKHTIFGQVVEGMGTVDALEAAGTRRGRPVKPLTIEHATIIVE